MYAYKYKNCSKIQLLDEIMIL